MLLCLLLTHLVFGAGSSEQQSQVWLTFTSGGVTISPVARCAVLSACVINPGLQINLVSQKVLEGLEEIRKFCPNNVVNKIESFSSILQGTPLSKWYDSVLQKDGKYANPDVSDALRLALLWRYGGYYLDTDVITLKSFRNIPPKCMGKQIASMDKRGRVPLVNGAVLAFDASHPFVGEAMARFNARYDPKLFASVGPNLLWDVYVEMNSSIARGDGAWVVAQLPTLLPKDVFYPIKFKSAPLKNWFAKQAPDLPWFSKQTIGKFFYHISIFHY